MDHPGLRGGGLVMRSVSWAMWLNTRAFPGRSKTVISHVNRVHKLINKAIESVDRAVVPHKKHRHKRSSPSIQWATKKAIPPSHPIIKAYKTYSHFGVAISYLWNKSGWGIPKQSQNGFIFPVFQGENLKQPLKPPPKIVGCSLSVSGLSYPPNIKAAINSGPAS